MAWLAAAAGVIWLVRSAGRPLARPVALMGAASAGTLLLTMAISRVLRAG